MTTNVPTQGFQAPPASAPAVPGVDEQGFAVPPAGSPARAPGNGNPITLPGQVPGYVNAPGMPPAVPGTPPAAAPVAQPADLTNIVAMLQAALGAPAGTQPAAGAPVTAADTALPNWLGGDVNTFDVATINDPIIRSMASIMQTAGKDLDLNRAMGNALAHNDVSLVDVAYLTEKGGANAAQLAEIAKGIVQAVGAKADAVTADVYASVGGEANWHTSVAAFNQSAPPELRMTVARMLDSVDDKFIKAGAKIVAEFGKNSGMIPQQGAPLLSTATAGMQGQGLSKAQFQAELGKIKPDTPGYEETRQDLFARRSLGKRGGL